MGNPHHNSELIRRVLGDAYLALAIKRLVHEESLEESESHVRLTMTKEGEQEVTGQGVGVFDALWEALQKRFADEYTSLKTIELAKFSVRADIDTKKRSAGVDAMAEVIIEIRNSEGLHFSFSHASRSIVSSGARAVIMAVEYFINSERAFLTLFKSRQDAKERNRQDLVSRYTSELAEVVKSTSYSELIDAMRKAL